MGWPTVDVNQLNQLQGETNEIERVLLYVGTGTTNAGKTLAVNTQSNFDALLGAADSVLKSNVNAAMLNAGSNWSGFVHVLAADAAENAWVDAVLSAQSVGSFEGVVLLDDIATKTPINSAVELRAKLLATFSRWSWFILSVQPPQEDEAWNDYLARVSALQAQIAAPSVQLVPRLFGNDPGVLAGRLCNRAVTIADSPARVKTGALVSLGSDDMPLDGTGVALELATLQALQAQRFSVPMWYPDYDGYYWADGVTLDAEGGDYQAIEYLRIADKAARRVRLQAIAKIADRSLNSTPSSIAAHQAYFAKVLREMSISSQINGITFPGEVKPPQDDDVTITWLSATKVAVYIVIRPYECPKGITVSLMLDTSLSGSE